MGTDPDIVRRLTEEVRGIEIWRSANGKIVEHWGVVDISDVLEKAGLAPG